MFAKPWPAQTSKSALLSPFAAFTGTAMMSMIILSTILNSVPRPMSKLKEALARLTVDELKSLMRCLPEAAPTGRKDELVNKIHQSLDGAGLHALWNRLDDMQRLAVAETLYAVDGIFHPDRFHAKYGQLPDFSVKEPGSRYSYHRQPTPLALMLYYQEGYYSVPGDLCGPLRAFAPEPAPVQLRPVEVLPEMIDDSRLVVRNTERDAMVDLTVLLRLVDQGKIQVSDKTSLPGTATLRLLTDSLVGGDFYAGNITKPQRSQEIGPIKAFSWPVLLQAAGLVQRNGSRLALTPAGLKALSASPADVLGTIWKKWRKSSLLDEFSRIDTIKGQKSKSRVMTALPPRRAVIGDMLGRCPVKTWISVDDFSRFMQATAHTFEVTHDPWALYICEREYGSLGHDGFHSWDILQLRYLLCFLFEYAAPLGIIDVAYIEPHGARDDFRELWGADDLEFLSRYDGLVYFRLTPLGAYCLGLTDNYTMTTLQRQVAFSILPSLHVHVVKGRMSIEEMLLLDTWAEKESEESWRLDRQKALRAIENGHDIAELRAFLQAREAQTLPEPVEAFLKTTQKQGRALKIVGTALLVQCEDAATAEMIVTRKETAGLCLRAGERHLVVRPEHEDKFRALVRALGLGMAI